MTNSPVLASIARGLGIAVLLSVCTYFMVPGNTVVFGSWASLVVIIASTIDGIIEKSTNRVAFGSVSK